MLRCLWGDDGSLVLSCWSLYFSRPDRETLRYTDRLSRWAGNEAGNALLRGHPEIARSSSPPVRPVIATPRDRAVVDSGRDANTTRKTFHIRPELAGRLVNFDGDEFVIDFMRTPS
jgi:hypothetical protein